MREIIDDTTRWLAEGAPVALATVVKTWGSAPRKVAAKMAITPDGRLSGSVSGGCVEGAVFEAGVEALAGGGARLIHYGVADETAWTVGLACGGQIDVFVEPFDPAVQRTAADWIAREAAGAIATVIAGAAERIGRKLIVPHVGAPSGSIAPELDAAALEAARRALLGRQPQRVWLPDGETELFVDVIMPPPQLIMVGGVHIAVALAQLAEVVGFRPMVIDPRRAFGSAERFPHVRLIAQWPRKAFAELTITPSTAVALLTHDPKIDDQALEQVLASDAFYIGALGSKQTAAKRRNRLLEKGYTDAQIGRIHGPIGLPINAQTPEEIALAILAEIIQAYRA